MSKTAAADRQQFYADTSNRQCRVIASSVLLPGRSLSAQFLSASGNPKLRIAVVMDEMRLPACWRSVLLDLVSADYVSLDLICLTGRRLQGWQGQSLRKNIYRRIGGKHGPAVIDPLELLDCSDLIHDKTLVSPAALAERLGTPGPDEPKVLINLSVVDPIPDIASHGDMAVWSFVYGGSGLRDAEAPFVLDKIIGKELSQVGVRQVAVPSAQESIVARCIFSADVSNNPCFNRYGPLWGASHLIIRALRHLYLDGRPPAMDSCRENSNVAPPIGLCQEARWTGSMVAGKVARRLRLAPPLAIDHWKIGIRKSSIFGWKTGCAFDEFQWLESPKGHFWADPFLFEENGRTWLFFEELEYRTWHGTLRVAEVTSAGVGESMPCLSRPYHLSYPQVFRAGDEVYMLPETAEAGVIELYRATEFPYAWERVKTLLPLRAVDSTVVHYGGAWWMLATAMVVDKHAVTNLLFSAGHPLDEWKLIDTSWYCDDVRKARGAGAFVHDGEHLWRPSQDCAGRYGKRVVMNRVEELSSGGYAEIPIGFIEPSAGCSGLHTYNQSSHWEVIDACFSVAPQEVM